MSLFVALGVALWPAPALAHSGHTPTGESGRQQGYVALGDSVAAGLGLPLAGDTTAEDAACGRSAVAYPQVVAAVLGISLTQVACSGAHVSDLYGSQTVNDMALTPQLDVAFATGTPEVISITAGANDLHWADFVRECYVIHCGSDADDVAAKAARGYARAELFWTLRSIERRSDFQPPQVVVTGYFTPFSSQTCGDTQGLDPDEITWLNSQQAQLNQALYSVTRWFDFVTFAPVDFTGHELCAADPWIQGLSASAPFHPTAGGQQAIAAAVVHALRDE